MSKTVTFTSSKTKVAKTFSTKVPDPPAVIDGGGGVTEAGWHRIEAFMRCPKAGQYALRGIAKPLAETPGAFAKGGIFHAMRAAWFLNNFGTDEATWQKCLAAGQKAVEDERLPVNPKDEEYAQMLMGFYIEHWSRLPRPTPIAVEYKLGPAPLQKGDAFNMHRTARVDDLSKYPEAGGVLCIGELKTTSDDFSGVQRQYELHGQPILQNVLYRTCPNGAAKFGPVAGMLLDVVKKAYGKDKPKFMRVFVEIRPEVVEWYVESMRGYLAAFNKMDWDAEVPRNVTGCTYMAGRARVDCEFKDLCRFGASAAGRYVLPGGQSLRKYQPKMGATKMPWE